jgi:hypothetical protein
MSVNPKVTKAGRVTKVRDIVVKLRRSCYPVQLPRVQT